MSFLSKSKFFNVKRAKNTKKQIIEPVVFLVILLGFFMYLASNMGINNMMKTLMNTAHDLLLSTVFFIMGITVLMGALSKLMAEYGVVDMLEKILRPLMKPLFHLPGVAALGAVVTFLSDNPAVITLSKNARFAQHFKTYQLVSLTNFGTAWGMGLIVVVFMIANGFGLAAGVGVIGALIGCIISTRLMQRFVLKSYPELDTPAVTMTELKETVATQQAEAENQTENGIFIRTLNAALDGGKQGVDLGMAIIPGVLIISTIVMMLTFKTNDFTGAAYEGVGLLPAAADKISGVFEALFGFTDTQLLAFPMTALGAVGAALGIVPKMIENNIVDGNAIAVFTAIGMCWSGYLSTHAAMLDSLGYRKLISKAILAHTVAGLCAGVAAHWIYVGLTSIGLVAAPTVNVYIGTESGQIEVSETATSTIKASLCCDEDFTFQISDDINCASIIEARNISNNGDTQMVVSNDKHTLTVKGAGLGTRVTVTITLAPTVATAGDHKVTLNAVNKGGSLTNKAVPFKVTQGQAAN